MARSDRLLRPLQAFRSLPEPVTAARLAAETGVPVRTPYRDVDSLRAGGALIDGVPGFGFRPVEDPALPPPSRPERRRHGADDPAACRGASGSHADDAGVVPDARGFRVFEATRSSDARLARQSSRPRRVGRLRENRKNHANGAGG